MIALIDLEEGVRMVGEVADVPDDEIEIGMPLRVDFNKVDDEPHAAGLGEGAVKRRPAAIPQWACR